ncbi:MAG: TRAP transporter substrate-binding protein DctP [Acidobacteria bacterium]|nr:TRAP transporter substrate-binding protein DctP [Acidobacteriota bacterium]
MPGRPRTIVRKRQRAPFIRFSLLLALLLVAVAAAPAGAAGFTIKMATLSPDGSPWDGFFESMGQDWEKGTDGRVSLTIYPGGVAGDEPDILRKMKIGQYHAAALSVSGLADISKDFTVFEIPLFFRSEQEMFHVLGELTPGLRAKLDEKGFVLLGWGYVGQVHFFTNRRARTVEEMQRLKIFTWAGDEAMTDWWRQGGFKPVALAATDIVTGLQTGMIDALAVPPIYAMSVQFFKRAKYFADIPLIPMMGAIVVTKRAWNRVSEADRKVLVEGGRRAENRIFETIPTIEQATIKLMASQGLEVVPIVGTEVEEDWKRIANDFAEDMRGKTVPEAIFDRATAVRDAYREQQEAEAAAPAASDSGR